LAILVIGANGFIGRHVVEALVAAGHEVVRGGRPGMDLARDHDPLQWERRLGGIDIVVNAAGIFREAGSQTFENIHQRGPAALFAACAAQGVKVIQISALGADARARSRFHLTKRAGDDALLALPVPSVVLQPSLVFGSDGESARLFTLLASLPWIPLPAGGMQQVQPVHVDDLAQVVVAIVKKGAYSRTRVPVVGPAPLALREFLGGLRRALGLGRGRFVPIPGAVMRVMASLRIGMLDRESWEMLERGNTADASVTRELLGREPRAVEQFVGSGEREALLVRARLDLTLPLLRIAIAVMWLAAGVVSSGLYPVADSFALLARTGITGALASFVLYGAALFDFAMGIATLVMRKRRWLWRLQMATIVVYTAIITVFLPEQWLHPFGPVVKNLPILASIFLLHELEPR
jgi:uncharacterized protein YbjT (DUF2867 family)